MAGVTRVLDAFRRLKDAFPLLKVAGSTALSGVLIGLEALLEWSTPCPCDPKLNICHTVMVFLVPAVVFLVITLAAQPGSRRLLRGWTCWTYCFETVAKEREHCCRRCSSQQERCRFKFITLLEALIPSFFWFSILLIDGDHITCSFHTQAYVGANDSLDCKHICSDDPTPPLRRHCDISWQVSGGVFLVLNVCLLVILKFIPARKCDDCTQEGYYVVKFSKEIEAATEIKMEVKIKARVAECADGKAQKLMEVIELSVTEKKEQVPKLPKQVPKSPSSTELPLLPQPTSSSPPQN
ncbi:uncharacterized protein LOC144602710 [Rhinoraja longicauda]